MAKAMPDIEDTLAPELFNHFLEFIAAKGAVPLEHAFWRWLIRRGKYTKEALPLHVFRHQFGKCYAAGWIDVERDTRSLIPRRNVRITVDK